MLTQDDVRCDRHAIECRLYAENPACSFLPSPGRLHAAVLPRSGDGVRVDTGFEEGDEVTPFYDPLIAKVIVRGADREAAIERCRAALRMTRIEGVATNLALLKSVLDHPSFIDGRTRTNFLEIHKAELLEPA
jgi:3-methylcrotonyl-CoA carboxylase alpha subunit